MTDFNKLADALALKGQSWQELKDREEACREAAALLRAAAGVDVAGLMALAQDFGSARWAEGFDEKNKPHGQPARHKKEAVKQLTALESSLRLVLAQRVPPGCGAFDEAQERAAFESHLKAELKAHWLYNNPNGHELVDLMVSVTPDEVNGHKQTYAGRYVDKGVETQWHGWRARAAAAPQAKEQTA